MGDTTRGRRNTTPALRGALLLVGALLPACGARALGGSSDADVTLDSGVAIDRGAITVVDAGGGAVDTPATTVDAPATTVDVVAPPPDRGAEPIDTGANPPPDLPRPPDDQVVTVSPTSLDMVITRWSIDRDQPSPGPRSMFGFDLDNRRSPADPSGQSPADCSHGDHFSTLDPDQNAGTCVDGMNGGGPSCRGGVDNKLPTLYAALVNAMPGFDPGAVLSEDVATGRRLYAVRIRGINGPLGPTLNDPFVDVDLVPVWAAFPNCGAVGTQDQTYERSSQASVIYATGSIVDGRLRMNPAGVSTEFPFPVVSATEQRVTTPMRELRLRVTLTASGNGRNGNFGGYTLQSDLLDALLQVPSLAPLRSLVVGVIAGFVDLATPVGSPGATCASPSGAVSLGLGFEAMRARILSTAPRDRPAPGNCGATP